MRTTVALAVFSVTAWAAPPAQELLHALRDGDSAQVRTLVIARTALDSVDEFGASALMYAALYSDAATVRLLLDHGADPNHTDHAGATALMWAIPDEAKVRLLVERGADVNAVSKFTGRTALLIAAGRPGSARIVRLLLAKGADPKARDHEGETCILRAAASGDAHMVRVLLDRGADINAHGRGGSTPLMEAVGQGNRAVAEMLVTRGADMKARDEEGFSVLTSFTSYNDARLFRWLIAKGADPLQRTISGLDAVTAAAASDTSAPEVIRELAKQRPNSSLRIPNLHTQHGFGSEAESALDWAGFQGNTQMVRVLSEMSGGQPRPDAQIPAPRLNAPTPRAAIEKALPLLYEGGREFFKRSGCTSCHHNMLPSVAYRQARIKSIVVDEDKARRNYLQSVAWIKGGQDRLLQDIRLPGGDTTAAYLLYSLEAEGHPRDRATDALVHHLAGAQGLGGGWRVRADRPPLESGCVTPTALAIRALRAYPIPGRKPEFDARVRRAGVWLSKYRPRTGEERAMRLLGLSWAGWESGSIRKAAAELRAMQRTDGGWAQLDTLQSDAYATGQAMYALQTAGHLTDDTLAKGVRFLLETQLADGSWRVRSRAFPIQTNYFDTGFPNGRDQWISAAGTSWACIGLSLAIRP
jgi:ankyrin repeat protein